MNRVVLSGYLAADPKQNFTSKGHEQSLFTVAVADIKNYNESYFIPCVAWNRQAKFINENLKKGSLVVIDGRLVRRSYTDSEGKNVYIIEIQVDSIKVFSTKKNSNSSEQEPIDTITIIDEIIKEESASSATN